jgi:predicted DNA-binding transcriptional regulator AlpA
MTNQTNADKKHAPHDPGRKYISTKQLRSRWGGCSHMTIERKLALDPAFPKPINITRFRLWDLDEIEAYEKQKITEPRQKQGKPRSAAR